MYSAQLRPGLPYSDLEPCVAIFILGYADLPSSRFHRTFQVLEVRSGERFSDQLEVHFVELPKVSAAGESRGEEALLEDWGRFLLARSEQELEELAMSNPVIAKAKGALDFLSAQPDVQELALQRVLAQHNYITEIRAGEARGEARGEGRGKAEALRAAITGACLLLGIAVDDARQTQLVALDVAGLDHLYAALLRERAWPG